MANPNLNREILNNNVPYLEQRIKINSNFETLTEYINTENFSEKLLYVDGSTGNDGTGDGTSRNPYATIEHTLDQITDSSSISRYCILVAPGIYMLNNPVQLKAYVSIRSIGGNTTTRLEATNSSQDLFTDDGLTELSGLTLAEVEGASNYAIRATSSGPLVFKDISILNCSNGILLNNVASRLEIFNITCLNFTKATTNFLESQAGIINVRNPQILVASLGIENMLYANGASAIINSSNAVSIISGVTNGLHSVNNGTIVFSSTLLSGCSNGVRTNSGGQIRGSVISISNTVVNDVLVESVNDQVNLNTGELNINKVFTPSWDNVFLEMTSFETGDEGSFFSKEISVGVPEKGRESVFGEGDSTSRGMMAYSYDGAVFTDVSHIAESPSGSTFSFPTTTNSGYYLSWDLETSSDYKRPAGFKINVATPLENGTGSYVMEFWNGSSWQEFNYLVTDAGNPYISHTKNFDSLSGGYQIRFDIRLALSNNWIKNDPVTSGTERYWVRFRIVDSITTSPNIENIKLHTSRTEFNDDGWQEFFGLARPIKLIPWDWGLVQAANNSPANQDLFYSDSLAIGRIENNFVAGTVDKAGLTAQLPLDADTSCPLVLSWSFIKEDNSPGDIRWEVAYGYTKDGDSVSISTGGAPPIGATEKTEVLIQDVQGSAEIQFTATVLLDISEINSRKEDNSFDTLWLTLRRVGNDATDTYPDDIDIINIFANYFSWSNGGHFFINGSNLFEI